MSLEIRTFDNKANTGDPLFKALGHPAVALRVQDWIGTTAALGTLAVVDPWGQFSSLAALYDISALNIEGRYVQRVEDMVSDHRQEVGGALAPRSLLELADSKADAILLAAFDDDHARRAIMPLLPEGKRIVSFDDLKLEGRYLTNARRYLDPLNFATNFVLFRAGEGRHSVVRTINYWSNYGAVQPRLILTLFDGAGKVIAEWEEGLQPHQSIVLDAEEVRQRFGLAPFTGMLLIHAVGVAGHSTVKYVLDDVDDAGHDPALTHDSNSWPAHYYCGLPAPRQGESVRLWLQNTHPRTIPSGAMTIGLMGANEALPIEGDIPPYGLRLLKMEEMFPGKAWPLQFELTSGNHVDRPRYEIISPTPHNGATVTFAHMNVQRVDLRPDPAIREAAPLLGKGYILPAPILPTDRYRNLAVPTPAARAQSQLPLVIKAYGIDGTLMLDRKLGVFSRAGMPEIDVNRLLAEAGVASGFEGHFELMYDTDADVDVDGWLHALFRYIDIANGQMGDSSFGAHVFNLPITFRNEPQSYSGKAPGLSTRLFARMTKAPLEPFVHLTYTSSGKWRDHSDTTIVLHNSKGEELGESKIRIPMNGSRFLTAGSLFSADQLMAAGQDGYMMIVDKTCRLFGYHGVHGPDGQFALDHMFGF